MSKNLKSHGYVTLISISVVGMIALSIAITLTLFGVNSSQSSLSYGALKQAENIANACAEEALEVIKLNTSFTGTNNLNFGSNTCTYTVSSQGGQNRTIDASGSVNGAVRKIKVIISALSPNISITSWQDVADF
jgi:hypothetical protein